MGRHSNTQPCPACGEPMKVSRRKTAQKVCCPHCRQIVVLEPLLFPEVASTDLTKQTASLQLEEILTLCKTKRALLEDTQREITELETRARSLGLWLLTQGVLPEDTHATRSIVNLQARLFEQVQTLKKGHVALLDCDSTNHKSLAYYIRLTFEAFGWEVEIRPGHRPTHCGEEVTFIVAPGPVNYPVAAIYMALQSAGIRLHSQIDLAQNGDVPLLCVHRISNIPKLLPTPSHQHADTTDEELRKTA